MWRDLWQNTQWLVEEWRYYFEWRKLSLAATLENRPLPDRHNPWQYTFRWIGAVIIFPLLVLTILGCGVWVLYTSPQALAIIIWVVLILGAVGIVIWGISAVVSMSDRGPSYVVELHWKKTHGEDENPT